MLRVDYARWGQSTDELREHALTAPHRRTCERYMALYEVTQDSNATAVAEGCRRNPQTVMRWVHRYDEQGPEALIYQRRGGRPLVVKR